MVNCITAQSLLKSESISNLSSEQYMIWVDHPLPTARSGLSIFTKIKQTNDSYLEKFILANDASQAIETRYFSAQQKTRSGYIPYLIFYDIAILGLQKLTALYQFRNGNQYKNFAFTLDQASLIQPQSLPAASRAISSSVGKKFFNQIITPFNFLFYTPLIDPRANCQRKANYPAPKARLSRWESNGLFTVDLDLSIYDSSIRGDLRNGYVCDPVGNVLAFSPINQQDLIAQIQSPKNLNEINELSKANPIGASIFDCPFLRVLVEDEKNGYSMCKIPLR